MATRKWVVETAEMFMRQQAERADLGFNYYEPEGMRDQDDVVFVHRKSERVLRLKAERWEGPRDVPALLKYIEFKTTDWLSHVLACEANCKE